MIIFENILCVAFILFAAYLFFPLLQFFAFGLYSIFIDFFDWFISFFKEVL